MKTTVIAGFFLLLILLMFPLPATAAERLVLWDAASIKPEWQLVASSNETRLENREGGVVLTNTGESYLVYPLEFGYRDYQYLEIELKSDTRLELSVIPDVTGTARYTFELQKTIEPSGAFQRYRFSLHVPDFKKVTDLGIKIKSDNPARVELREIALSKGSFFETLAQTVADYLRVAPYAEYTVNLFPTPRIFGHAAFVYFLPVFALLCCLFLLPGRYRRFAIGGFLLLWLITDLRMNYEFLSYQAADYQTWVRPVESQKRFRTQGDLYTFIDWLILRLPVGVSSAHFYFPKDPYLQGIMQYYLYPVRLRPEAELVDTYIVYKRSDIRYDQTTRRLLQDGKSLTQPGTVVASFDASSFIFIPQ